LRPGPMTRFHLTPAYKWPGCPPVGCAILRGLSKMLECGPGLARLGTERGLPAAIPSQIETLATGGSQCGKSLRIAKFGKRTHAWGPGPPWWRLVARSFTAAPRGAAHMTYRRSESVDKLSAARDFEGHLVARKQRGKNKPPCHLTTTEVPERRVVDFPEIKPAEILPCTPSMTTVVYYYYIYRE
jgi:hypothetical protein